MFDLDNIKKFTQQHVEKVVFGLLVVCLVVFSFSHLNQLSNNYNEQNGLQLKIPDFKSSNKMPTFPEETYKKLVSQISSPKNLASLYKRDIFEKAKKIDIRVEDRANESTAIGTKDVDGDGMPNIWETQYGLNPENSNDATEDPDNDTYINLDEYIGGTDPLDPESFPGILKRFEIADIYRKKIKIRFFGYLKLPNGSYRLQINWANKTEFKKVGEKLRGYKITEFIQIFDETYDPLLGATQKNDISYIKIRKMNASPITLVLNQTAFERELFVLMKDKYENKVSELHGGSEISGYEVLDINPSKVIMVKNEKVYTLFYERRGNQ